MADKASKHEQDAARLEAKAEALAKRGRPKAACEVLLLAAAHLRLAEGAALSEAAFGPAIRSDANRGRAAELRARRQALLARLPGKAVGA